ncbi:MAG TPA: hypothetical protein VM531_04320 [Sphingomicrobium sp.]|jgi:hypothetical protein|nr:hypothetical protein [Sphingomicrobium sp.]
MPFASRRLKRAALESLLYWAEVYAFKGAGHPEDKPRTEAEYLAAINKIERILDIKETKKLGGPNARR